MKTTHVAAAAAALLFSAAAAAQNMKPGLWEVTQSMKSTNPETQKAMAQMQQQMATMSPEQKKMMQDMMAKQGMQMGAGGAPGGGQTVRTCVTKDQAERNELSPQRDGCKMTQQARSGNTMKMAFECTNPPSSGEGEYTFVSAEAYKMRMTVRTATKGRQETMNLDGSGKWLSANCGDVKPSMRPPAK